jgi:para-nitrobenzyl esterase
MNLVMGPDKGKTFTDNEIEERLSATYGDKKDQVVEEFSTAYPSKTKEDALYFDSFLRLPLLKIMTHKADQNGAPVYAYVMSYGSPLAYHTAEIPLVFNNADAVPPIFTGIEKSAAEKQADAKMADTMSSAWISFAKTGKPAASGLPEWQEYTRENGSTMIFDTESRLTQGHDRNLIKLLAPDYQW